MALHDRDLCKPDVRIQIILSCCEDHRALRARGALHRADLPGVRARWRRDDLLFLGFHEVGSRRQIIEKIHTARIRIRDGDDRLAEIDVTVAVCVAVENDGRIRHAGLAEVLHAVFVRVIEKRVADAARVVVAEVGGGHILARREDDGVARGREIRAAAHEFNSRRQVRVRFIRIHKVGACRQAGE